MPEAYATCHAGIELIKNWLQDHWEEVKRFANFSSYYAGLIDSNGCPDMYEGQLRITRYDGQIIKEFDPADYLDFYRSST